MSAKFPGGGGGGGAGPFLARSLNVLQQTACLVVGLVVVGGFALLFNCTPVGWTLDSMMLPT